MFSFIDHVNEIWRVSKVKNVDVGVAYDMFRADVAAGKALPYNTATVLPTFDFAKAKVEWGALTEEEQMEACTEWHAFVETNYEKICAQFNG